MSKKKKAQRFFCTDAGNAEMFAARCGEKVRFDHKQGRWLVWNEKRNRWIEDKQGKVRILAKQAARRRAKSASSIANDEESKREFSWARQSEGCYRIDSALDLAKSEPPIRLLSDRFGARPSQVGAANQR